MSVYYAWMPDPGLLKIGFTSKRVDYRMIELQRKFRVPALVQAIEPGDLDEERGRHHQWAHLREPGWYSDELFRVDEALRAHVVAVRKAYAADHRASCGHHCRCYDRYILGAS